MGVHDVFDLLDQEWLSYRHSRGARNALRRWKEDGSSFNLLDDLDAVVRAARGPRAHGADEILLGLVTKAPTDPVAARVALQTIVPGLAGVARTYRLRWGREETGAMVVAAAFERVVRYSCHRPGSPMGNLVLDVRHDLYELRLKEVALETALAEIRFQDISGDFSPSDKRAPAEELASVLEDAVTNGAIRGRQASLIYRRRVLGVSTDTLAEAEGLRPCTIRKHRREAERALVASARQVA